jgi:magnesium transporter
LQHNIKTIPIVDKNGKFMGAVSSKKILNIMHTEAVEDALHYAGIQQTDGTDITKISVFNSIKRRIPWLIVGLLGGILTAQIIGIFDSALRENLILTIFMPIVIYMADAVASQTQVLFIRNLTTNHHLVLRKYLAREINISIIVALICSIFFGIISIFWHFDLVMSFILGLSLFIAICFAISIAIFVPWIINRFKKDPAVGSGPFATILTDILSLIVYFSVTTVLIEIFTK